MGKQTLDQQELLRYQRQLPVIGLEGQRQLKAAKVLCVGGGGLGCPALQYLAAAGVGTLAVIDGDMIELSNLHRQILFQTADLGRNKAEVIAERLTLLNPHITVHPYAVFLSEDNATSCIDAYDLILDATDNYEARYLINAVCRRLKKPLISASIYQFDAQLSVFNYKNGPCYQCLYPEPPLAALAPNCAAVGVLGVLPGVTGILQASEAIKVLLELGDILSGVLLSIDVLSMQFRRFEIPKQGCASHPPVQKQVTVCQEKAVSTMNAKTLSEWMKTDPNAVQLIDVREPFEWAICHIGGDLIPLSTLETQLMRLQKDKVTVVYCKSGFRSAHACQLLLDAGFSRVANLEGGIIGWIETVDGSLSRY